MSDQPYICSEYLETDCQYHVVFMPRGKAKVLYKKIRLLLESLFIELAEQKNCTVVEKHIAHDHVHLLLRISSQQIVPDIINFLKGRSAVEVAKRFCGDNSGFSGGKLWEHGFAASTVEICSVEEKQFIEAVGR